MALINRGYVHLDITPLKNMDLGLQPSFGYNFVKLDNQLIMNDIFRLYAGKYFGINESWTIKGYLKIDS